MNRRGAFNVLRPAWVVCVLGAIWFASSARAAIQFDVFLGYDDIVPESSWFPIVCEVKNDGPPFTGTIEVTSGTFDQGQSRRFEVELPTGTLKRLVIPVFSSMRGYANWDVRLLDDHGKVREEASSKRPRKQLAVETPLLGAITRTPSGAPQMRSVAIQSSDFQPSTARFQVPVFPDNPLTLEGLRCIYMTTDKAVELGDHQVAALLAWLKAGGHLIIGVEQVGDISAKQWLKSVLPCEVDQMQTVAQHPEINDWLRRPTWHTNVMVRRRASGPFNSGPTLRPAEGASPDNPFANLPDDFGFEAGAMQVATGKLKDGQVVIGAGDIPLVVTAPRGRGMVTQLLFSPEREPFRSWKNLSTFWAKLAEVPGAWYVSSDFNRQGSWGSDGIFGAMIETRQVHKLPIEWLLLLLIVYLVVIGPLDQYWLKRIGRPMLTWITFPCYVIFFSLLIYFIGYKLRAGESEWNELHIVDVLPGGAQADMRGRTYSSVYAPSNQRYDLASSQRFATLRGELVGGWAAGQNNEKLTVHQNGDGYKAEIYVPVWTSQLFVSDWWDSAPPPLNVSVTRQESGWQVKVQNLGETKLTNLHLAIENFVGALGDLAPKEARTLNVTRTQLRDLSGFVGQTTQGFAGAVNSRRRAFGASESGHIDDKVGGSIAASFLSYSPERGGLGMYGSFISPPGLDLSPVLEHGGAVLFAWADGFSPTKPNYQFTPRRGHHDTLWRVPVTVE